jgi:hypothetical protein
MRLSKSYREKRLDEERLERKIGDRCRRARGGGLDGIGVPVTSWGIFMDVLGEKNKHIIFAQNDSSYAGGSYDVAYTAISVTLAANVPDIAKTRIPCWTYL